MIATRINRKEVYIIAQVSRGLLGTYIAERRDKSGEPEVIAKYTVVLNDTAMGFILNGKMR